MIASRGCWRSAFWRVLNGGDHKAELAAELGGNAAVVEA